MEKIKIQLDEKAYMPERTFKQDAGADIRTPYGFTLWPGEYIAINTGVHVEIPEGYMVDVRSKSGLMRDYGIFTDSTIDSGYSGSMTVFLFNFSKKIVTFKAGYKIAQIVFTKIETPEFVQVEQIEGGERGAQGFGSTGR